ncbi:TolC family protein [Massilia solisilvae]|uniref:TolC family protein n=1 Tax=Massilia solisilvae TaxID=1811225 RepID=A0ABT2BP90_9BURK|nr:TolC family protein [Massilia solisilvae]MCS0610326.1 TolC family protein [Massilia solisilvae]
MTSYRSSLTRTAVAAAAALLAACTTVGPDYHVPDEAVVKRPAAAAPFMGAAEQPFKSEPLPADWWRLYHDSTLDKLIEKAFAANADLRMAAANLKRSHAVLEEVEEKKRPEVEMEAAPAYGRIAGMSLGLPEVLPDTGLYSGEVKVSYQLDLFGKIKRGIEAAQADEEAAQAASDIAHVTVAAETARAYADACSAGYQVKVAQHSVDLQQQFVDLTADRVKKGRGIALDNSRARAQLEQLRAALPPLQAQRRTALYKLAVLTGEVPSSFPAEVARCEVPPHVASAIPVGDGAALLRRRPDIRQAERMLAGATARIGVATAELYPSINLGASFGSIGMIPGVGDANTWHYALGPLIRWSLPATSPARVHIAQARAGTEGALARFDSVVLGALRETESALTVYARELDRNAALKASRDQSALAARQADKLYQFGRADFLTKLDADRALAVAESAVAVSDTQLATDQVNLFLSLGGGWESTRKQQRQEEKH